MCIIQGKLCSKQTVIKMKSNVWVAYDTYIVVVLLGFYWYALAKPGREVAVT
jgi:hypothetical protein